MPALPGALPTRSHLPQPSSPGPHHLKNSGSFLPGNGPKGWHLGHKLGSGEPRPPLLPCTPAPIPACPCAHGLWAGSGLLFEALPTDSPTPLGNMSSP